MPGRTEGDGARERALVELQIHPQDIRKNVRYLFLTRGQVTALATGLGVFLLLALFAAAVSPAVVGELLRAREYRRTQAEALREQERLEGRIAALEALRAESKDLRLLLDKVFVLYGLSSRVSEGQGGYPFLGVDDEIEALAGAGTEERLEYARLLEASMRERMSVAGFFLEEIEAFEEERRDRVELTPSISPLRRHDFVLTSPFGDRRNPFTKNRDFHAGIDMAALRGVPVRAPAAGEVLFAGRYSLQRSVGWWRYGNLVILGHGDHFRTVFGHCDELRVSRGDRVSQGQVIATVGSTGMSTSPHLHYEVRRRTEDGSFRPVDPRIYILDQAWSDEEQILVRSRSAPPARDVQPLPRLPAR